MRRLSWLLAVVALAASACGTTKDTGFSPTPTPTETEDAGEDTSTLDEPAEYDPAAPLSVADNLFVPRFVSAEAGTTVEWIQTGSAPHNVVADDGAFDSHPDCRGDNSAGCMAEGDQFGFEFDEPGEYPYYCVIHGGPGQPDNPAVMAGVIIVT
jgi:plastocyanin